MSGNDFERIAQFLFEAGQLARTPRSGYSLLRSGEQSVAEHAHRTATIAFVLGRIAPGVDFPRLLTMALLHDLPEARTSDLNHLSKRYLTAQGAQVAADQTAELPFGEEVRELIEEYERGESAEARLARDADRIELLLTLREQETSGRTNARRWIDRTTARIETDSGRRLAQAVVEADPDRWWDGPAEEVEAPP